MTLRCATLGPFASAPAVDAVVAALDASLPRQRRDAAVPKLWAVLTPLVDDPAELVERLAAAGNDDHRLMKRGEWKGRVSLGSYSAQRSAERRLQALRELGFEVEVVPGPGRRAEIWLDLPATPYDAPLPAGISEILADDPSLAVRSVPCTRLASR